MLDEIGNLVRVSNDTQRFTIRFASLCRVRSASVSWKKNGTLPSSQYVQISFGMTFAGMVMDSNCRFCFGHALPGQFWIRFAIPIGIKFAGPGEDQFCNFGFRNKCWPRFGFSLQV